MSGWWDERLDVRRLRSKLLRKAFPVHHSFFLGEIALFAFVTLVVTGAFLSVNYEGSERVVRAAGRSDPAAFASIRYIDSLPLGRVLRSAHHWSAHVMVAASALHLVRVALTGAYKKPRELNWLVGLLLLAATVVTAFTGYALPHDAFAVTATTIGYGIGASVPWIGQWLAKFLFGGQYPTVHSLPRLLVAHVVWMPLALTTLLAVHLLLMVKQKHTQPPYAARVAPGKVLGMPLVPEQAVTMAILLCLHGAVVFAMAGLFDVHPVAVYGPPTATTPIVKPDWYFLWVYGILQLIPSSWNFRWAGATFGPELWGGVVVPALVVLGAAAAPFLDPSRTRVRYAERPVDHPVRTGIVLGVLTFFAVGTLAGYRDGLGIPIWVLWALLLAGPVGVAATTAVALLAVRARSAARAPAAPEGRTPS